MAWNVVRTKDRGESGEVFYAQELSVGNSKSFVVADQLGEGWACEITGVRLSHLNTATGGSNSRIGSIRISDTAGDVLWQMRWAASILTSNFLWGRAIEFMPGYPLSVLYGQDIGPVATGPHSAHIPRLLLNDDETLRVYEVLNTDPDDDWKVTIRGLCWKDNPHDSGGAV